MRALLLAFALAIASGGAASPATARAAYGGAFFLRQAVDLLPVQLVGTVRGAIELPVAPEDTATPSAPAGDSPPPPRRVACALLSVEIDATVTDTKTPLVQLEFTHRFRNNASDAAQAEFIFPLMPTMAVTALVATTPRGTYRGVVMPKAQARAEYAAAVARGDGAFLSEYAGQPDLLRLRVGNVLPEDTITVRTEIAWFLHSAPSVGWAFELPLTYVLPYFDGPYTAAAIADYTSLAAQPPAGTAAYS